VTSSASPGLARFNATDGPEAVRLLHEVCGSREWCAAVFAAHPYESLDALLTVSDRATAALTVGGLGEAMAGHPPIGRPKPGDRTSAREQSGVQEFLRAQLLELNLAYQEQHGHVFLICATGRTGDQMLAALKERIGNDTGTEREIVRFELGKINRIRLQRLLEEWPVEEDPS
jgi:2-oxo-4-hydroxy-4-carboxy-5-ureidoimidazoline decarboxylase